MADPSNLGYLRRDAALFVGPLPPSRRHAHVAVQGTFALEGVIGVELDGEPTLSCGAILIASDVPHAVTADGVVVHFYASPATRLGAGIAATLEGHPWRLLPEARLSDLRAAAARAISDEARMPDLLESLLGWAGGDVAAPAPPDDRVRRALLRLGANGTDSGLEDLAREVGLSPDRLRHLLREEIGAPLRRYRRWMRLLVALDALIAGRNVTDAAIEAGFADAAHLSRVFREAFARPPSAFLRDSRFVQADDPPAP